MYVGGVEVMKGNITAGNIAEFIVYLNMLFPGYFIGLGNLTDTARRGIAKTH
jgi:ATP-binding cassette subfamily B multidrug efflux pump